MLGVQYTKYNPVSMD